jgi:hypothetical protein
MRRVRERRKGEKRRKREGDDVDTLTCGAYMGPRRLSRTKLELKPPKKKSKINGFVVEGYRISLVLWLEDDFATR